MPYSYINAVRSLQLPPGVKHLAYALAFRANAQGSCYPSVRTISADTGLSRSTIFAHLKILRDKGLLRVQSQFRADGGRKSSLYTLLVDCAKKAAGAVKKALRPVGMGNKEFSPKQARLFSSHAIAIQLSSDISAGQLFENQSEIEEHLVHALSEAHPSFTQDACRKSVACHLQYWWLRAQEDGIIMTKPLSLIHI